MNQSQGGVSPDVDTFLSAILVGYVSNADAAEAAAFARELRGEGDAAEAVHLPACSRRGRPGGSRRVRLRTSPRERPGTRRQNSPRVELQPGPAQEIGMAGGPGTVP